MSLTIFLSRPVRAAFFWAAFGGWVGILWTLSAGPPVIRQGPAGLPIDKVLHLLYFFGGGVCLMLACLHTFARRGWGLALAVGASLALIGALDEWHQTFTPGREGGDPKDWAADCAGGLAAAFLIGALYGRYRKSETAGA